MVQNQTTERQASGRGSVRRRVGVTVRRGRPTEVIDILRRAEAVGVGIAWLTMTATGLDTPTIYAAGLVQTERITLGTAIVPAFTRHPLTLATQALVLEDLAPGRTRLGIGTSHGPTMAGALGLAFDQPLARLREYLQVLRPALHDGRVSFAGEYYRVEAKLPGTAPTPILISALRERAFALAGELSDGAISWLCPSDYLLNHAKPALEQGAARAGRAAPPLVAHVPVALMTDRAAVRAAARTQLAGYGRLAFYARMFADAGFPLGPDGVITDDLVDHLVLSGDDDAIGAGLQSLLDRGLDDLLVGLITGPDPAAEEQRLFEIAGRL